MQLAMAAQQLGVVNWQALDGIGPLSQPGRRHKSADSVPLLGFRVQG